METDTKHRQSKREFLRVELHLMNQKCSIHHVSQFVVSIDFWWQFFFKEKSNVTALKRRSKCVYRPARSSLGTYLSHCVLSQTMSSQAHMYTRTHARKHMITAHQRRTKRVTMRGSDAQHARDVCCYTYILVYTRSTYTENRILLCVVCTRHVQRL